MKSLIKLILFGVFMATASTTMADKSVLILLGPPGSGKGTQAVMLSKELSLPHISTGDLFRENIAKGTELGKQAKSYVESGTFPPESLVLDLLFDRISKPDSQKGFLLDGFPRTLYQAEEFDRRIGNQAHITVINLDVPDDIIEKRIEGRLTCKTCGKIYNKYFTPPTNGSTCDSCQGELFQRPDDKKEVVQERLRVYHSQTKPLIGYYQAKGILKTIDGQQSSEKVYQDILKSLKK